MSAPGPRAPSSAAAITPPKPPAPQGRPPARRLAYWDKFYATHDESPGELLEKVALLRHEGKLQEVEAILLGFLRHRPKAAEAWMYELLAVSMEFNQGRAADVRQALTYAAQLALKHDLAGNLVTIADLLAMRGYDDQAAPLLDRAIEKLPHRAEPLVLSMALAQKTKDPRRMAEAAQRLLALGWPGGDEAIRAEARRRAEALARTLREDGRTTEADDLLGRLAQAETRDLYVRLTWTGLADLDLAVEEPLGAIARYDTPRTVFGGAIVKNGRGKDPEEIYVCPRGFDGDYTIRVETIVDDPDRPVTEARLEIITHEGSSAEQKQTRTITLPQPQPLVVRLQGGRRTTVLPFVASPVVVVRPKAERAGRAGSGPAAAAAPGPALPGPSDSTGSDRSSPATRPR